MQDETTVIGRHVAIQASRLESPLPILWWSGVSILAGILGRGVCTKILGPHGPPLFPNLFVVLVAEANSGKSLAVRGARDILDSLYIRQAADSTPPEAFLNWISQSTIKCSDESRDTGLFLALESMDSFFDRRIARNLKALLNAAYDCSPRYLRQTIKHKNQPLAKLCLNILAAGTPAHIGTCFGADDWVDGLASRFLFIAGGKPRVGGVTDWDEDLDNIQTRTLASLRSEVDSLASPIEISWAEDAWQTQMEWRVAASQKPPHPHASGYWARRHTSAVKLATLLAVSRAGQVAGTRIDARAWEESLEALAEVESGLPYCLAYTGANPYAGVQSKILEWAASVNRSIRERELRRHLWQFIPPQYADSCVEQLVAAGLLVVVSGHSATAPNRLFVHHSLQGTQSWSAAASLTEARENRAATQN